MPLLSCVSASTPGSSSSSAMASSSNGRDGEMCDDYGTWTEEIYWKHFKCLHFCQILPSSDEFHNQLLIPKKFADNARANLPQKVTLRGPGGASWCAVTAMIGSDLFLSDGWGEFAKAYSLQPNNILIFKYDGVSIFDVLIFDGENLCEKESAYFVKKCGLVDPSIEAKRKRISSDDDAEENGDDADVERGSKQAREEVGKKGMDDSKKVLRNTEFRSRSYAKREKFTHRESSSSKAIPAKKVPTTPKNLAKSFGVEDIDPGSPESFNNLYVSEAGKIAVERARKEMTEASFFAIMRPTSVSRRFLLTVPGAFQKTHLAPKTQDVFLRTGDKTWLTRLNCSPDKTTWQICSGWKQFALENHLEQFDVCLFKLVHQHEDSVMLDVSIFRAEPAPPSPPLPPMKVEVDPPIHVFNG